MDLQLKGRTAIVTGASAGIGSGIAECLAREGTTLALAGRNRAALEQVAAQACSLGAPAAHVVDGDVDDRSTGRSPLRMRPARRWAGASIS